MIGTLQRSVSRRRKASLFQWVFSIARRCPSRTKQRTDATNAAQNKSATVEAGVIVTIASGHAVLKSMNVFTMFLDCPLKEAATVFEHRALFALRQIKILPIRNGLLCIRP